MIDINHIFFKTIVKSQCLPVNFMKWFKLLIWLVVKYQLLLLLTTLIYQTLEWIFSHFIFLCTGDN